VATFVGAMIESMGSRLCSMREQERLFPIVVNYLSEGNAEPRAAGKRAILHLHEHNKSSGEFERLLRRCADADIRVVEKLLAQEYALHGAFAVTALAHSRSSSLGASLPRSSRSAAPPPCAARLDQPCCLGDSSYRACMPWPLPRASPRLLPSSVTRICMLWLPCPTSSLSPSSFGGRHSVRVGGD
jgi:hypothetical protein